MEDNGIKPGDYVIIKDAPKLDDEWDSPKGAFKVTEIKASNFKAPSRPYIYIHEKNWSYNRAFDLRRGVNVNSLSKLEKVLYDC